MSKDPKDEREGMAARVKKIFGFGSHHNQEEEEEHGESATGSDERRTKFADVEKKPRFVEPVTSPTGVGSGKKQTKKVVTVEVPTGEGTASKQKPTSTKKQKAAAAPQGVRERWRGGRGSYAGN